MLAQWGGVEDWGLGGLGGAGAGGSGKKELDIMGFKLYEVKFDLTCERHLTTSKTYFMNI